MRRVSPASRARSGASRNRPQSVTGPPMSSRDPRVLGSGIAETAWGMFRTHEHIYELNPNAVFNGSADIFVLNTRIARSPAGRPLCALVWKTQLLTWTEEFPPAPTRYAILPGFSDTTYDTEFPNLIADPGIEYDVLILGSPPDADDLLYFLYYVPEISPR